MIYNLLQPLPNNYFIAFIIGILSVYPSIMPTILSIYKNKQSCDIYQKSKIDNLILFLPIIYGILSISLFLVINKYLPKVWRNYWILGFIIALIYPTLGTLSGHAKTIYSIKSTPLLYIGAQILYLTFYGVIVNLIITNSYSNGLKL